MNTFCLCKEISLLRPSASKWYLIALFAICLPSNHIHASSDDEANNSRNENLFEAPSDVDNEDEESSSSQTDTGKFDNEDIDTLRDRIKQINFKLIKTPTKNSEERKSSWKNSPYSNLNKALKKIKITIPPTDHESLNFVKNKKKISVYNLLKMLLHEKPKSNNTPHNSDENIEEEELTPQKTLLEQCPAALLMLLNKGIEKCCREQVNIEKKKIPDSVLGEHYYYVYLREVYRLKFPKGHHRTRGTNLLYAMKSCDKNEYFDALELHKEMYNDSSAGSEDDAGTVIIGDEINPSPTSEQNYTAPLIIFATLAAGSGYHLNKKTKRKKNKKMTRKSRPTRQE